MIYKDALNTFNLSKSTENRELLCLRKAECKNEIKNKKRNYIHHKVKEIEALRSKKPKDFWKLFTKRKTKKGQNITNQDFYEYFKNISEEINTVENDEAEQFCNSNLDCNDPIFQELDVPIGYTTLNQSAI